MIAVAPATHDFGTVHTELEGNATLFLGNPTFADAEWSLVHMPAPPPKIRPSYSPPAVTAGAAATTTVTPVAGGAGGNKRRVRSAGRSPGSLVVDDASVFVFGEKAGVAPGVKLPLKSSAACLPEDWNRLEVRVGTNDFQGMAIPDGFFECGGFDAS